MRIAAVLLTCLGMLVVGHVKQAPYRFVVFGGDQSNTAWLYTQKHQTRWCGGGDCDPARPFNSDFTTQGYDYEYDFESGKRPHER